MTRTHFVAMTVIALGFAASAHAQTTDDVYVPHPPRTTIVRMDPLDPISRVAMLAARSNSGTAAVPVPLPTPIAYFASPATPAPVAQPAQTVAEEKSAGPSRFFSALNGISAGLAVSHEALDVYEHAIEANALKNYYNGR